MDTLANKVALVTGAGQGMGRGIAYALASEGAAVAVVGRTESKLEDTAVEIERRGGSAIPVVADVTDEGQIEQAVNETVGALGGLDVLVNNAQEFNFGSLLEIPLELVDAGWRSGPLATLLFMRAGYPHLRNGGVIINVSSTAAVDAELAGIGAYSAAKSAIDSFTRAAAVEWAADGIRALSIMPIARTPALQSSLDQYPGLEDRVVGGIPLGRIGDPETDIGAPVAFLASGAAGYITGTTLSIDGGSVRLR